MFLFKRNKINPYLKKVPRIEKYPFCVIKKEEAIEMISNSKLTETVILDVRTKHEYEICHIKNSINIEVKNINKNILLSKNKRILIYCSNGNRAVKAAYLLSYLGFKKLFIWEGGSIYSMTNTNLIE